MRILYEKIEDRETGGTVSGAEASAGVSDGTEKWRFRKRLRDFLCGRSEPMPLHRY